ncbi:MAG: ABC transporter permease [Nitrospira sp.]|nr:MAG: ABC transporter permease [Nitrospira sp.]
MGVGIISWGVRRFAPPAGALWFLGLFFGLGGLAVASLGIGRYGISASELARFVLSLASDVPLIEPARYDELQNVIFHVRLPRVVAAILIGAGLSASGAAFQAMFRNPLVSPGLLGVLAGASFGAAVAMLLGDRWILVQAGAFAGGLVAVCVTLGLARIYQADSLLMLVLGGIISTGLFTSLLSIVKALADPYNQLPAIVFWLMGRLSAVDAATVSALSIPILAGIAILLLLGKALNVLSMGDEEALTLGVNVPLARGAVILAATFVSALTVSMAGMIAWVGLVIPHVARLLVGPDNRLLLPSSALLGAAFLLVVDDVARVSFSSEIPIGVATELIGIPLFIAVLRRGRAGWLT